ncbi:hem peroxidase [Dillenia turbinata]|uniref:Peroxidase n=1 Tax=Dillenia turbinata TaxID=194707 RepID=A0AAN8UU18_9MAGN
MAIFTKVILVMALLIFRILVLALLIFRITSVSNPTELSNTIPDQDPIVDVSAIASPASRLSYDFYRNTCPAAEEVIGGPYYPVLTGRRDCKISYFNEATNHIPQPTDNETQLYRAFSQRGFNARETVALLGGHNIGRIGCGVIRAPFNLSGTGNLDPSVPADPLNEMRRRCPDQDQVDSESPSPAPSSDSSAMPAKSNNNSMPDGEKVDTHIYKNLLKGKGLLFSDQQLIARATTSRIVRAYASDDRGEQAFGKDFTRAMIKLSNLDVLSGDEGEIRLSCSLPRNTRVLDYGQPSMVFVYA